MNTKSLTKKVLNENCYSVDMVRLKIRVPNDSVQSFFNSYSCDSNVTYWETSKFTEYRHQWLFKSMDNVTGKEKSFWVGFCFNSEVKSLKHWLVIEYNPNKHDIRFGELNKILTRFFANIYDTEIASVDLACDMPVNINNLFFDKGGKKVKKIFDYGGDNKTIYYGQGNGRTKIYNKAREIGLDNVDLTRYEVTMSNFDHFPVRMYETDISPCIKVLPVYCIESYQFSMHLNSTDKAIIYAILSGYPIEELSRDKRGKIKKILSESAGNTIESAGFARAFTQYFKLYTSVIYPL